MNNKVFACCFAMAYKRQVLAPRLITRAEYAKDDALMQSKPLFLFGYSVLRHNLDHG